MSSPKFSTLLVYVSVFLIGGLVVQNYFESGDNLEEMTQQFDNQETEESVTIFDERNHSISNSNAQDFPTRIWVNIGNGEHKIYVKDIIYCESIKNTKNLKIMLTSGEIVTVKQTTLTSIKEEMKNAPFFFYELNAFIINFNHVSKIIRHEGNYNKTAYTYSIIMDNNEEITLPKAKKDAFMTEIKELL